MPYLYLDHAAATPLDPEVFDAMVPVLKEQYYNPSALYLPARDVANQLGLARQRTAAVLGVKPSEIIFTAGGTEANNLAIRGIMDAYSGKNCIISAIEHDSVKAPAALYDAKLCGVDDSGCISLSSLEQLIDDDTVLVSIMYVNNEIGTIQPLREVAELLNKVRKSRTQRGIKLPLYFHTDACQAGNYLSLNAHQLGVDMATVNGSKLYGPKQSGCLYVAAGVKLCPLVYGGGQESGLRSGTENVASVVGFSHALKKAQAMRTKETKRMADLQKAIVHELPLQIPGAQVNGSIKRRIPNNLNIVLPGVDNERLIMELDVRGIACAAGSACSASKEEPSATLQAIGLAEADIRSSIRISMGRGTSRADIERLIAELRSLTV